MRPRFFQPHYMKQTQHWGLQEIATNRNNLITLLVLSFPEHEAEIKNATTFAGQNARAVIKKESVSVALAAKIQAQFPQSIR